MAVIAQTSDRWGRTVELTDVGWQHIIREHAADLAGRQADVLRAVERPDCVNFDADYAERESFYRAMAGRGTGRRWYLKVCIEYGHHRHGLSDRPHQTQGANEMAMIHRPREAVYHWPAPAALNPADMLLGYNPLADILTVAFGNAARPAIVSSLDWTSADYVALRLDPDTDEVVGIHLEAVRIHALGEHPDWRPVVEAAPSAPGLQRATPSVWPALTAFIADVKALSEQ